MGMSKDYIARKFDEIVDFAEMAEFIDTPVKRYSSGMKVKLAFSVATSIDAEILIVDEVLAVGDLAFQQKCIERMEALIKREGRTVVIVGHNIRQMQRICERVMLLDHGKVSQDGNPSEVCGIFYDEAQRRNIARHAAAEGEIQGQRTTGVITVKRIELLDDRDNSINEIGLHQSLKIRTTFSCVNRLENVEIVVGIHTPDFVHVLSVGNALYNIRPTLEPGMHQFVCQLSDIPLRPGNYALRMVFFGQYKQVLWSSENILPIQVTSGGFDITKLPNIGLVDVAASWEFFQPPGEPSNKPIARIGA
jgi:lipopolysaccharide transport system ATP-binding protein